MKNQIIEFLSFIPDEFQTPEGGDFDEEEEDLGGEEEEQEEGEFDDDDQWAKKDFVEINHKFGFGFWTPK